MEDNLWNRAKRIRKRLKEAEGGIPATEKIDGETGKYSGYGVGGRYITEEGAAKSQEEKYGEEERKIKLNILGTSLKKIPQ